jgi:DNA-directed RNA polymerase specialized sigma24 family protein
MAMRHASTPDEADDLVQDVLLAAIEQGREVDGTRFLAWASGVLRRRALFLARTAGRRKRREAAYAAEARPARTPVKRLPRPFIDSLPASLQTVAFLANSGLGRHEIARLLRIPDTALRQRISALRRAWKRSGHVAELVEILPQSSSSSAVRRSPLKKTLVKLPKGRFAVADPDGHPVYLSSAHNSPGRGN